MLEIRVAIGFVAERASATVMHTLVVDEDHDSCARHGSEKTNPRLPCNAGQAR